MSLQTVCSLCGQIGATKFTSTQELSGEGVWNHVTCLVIQAASEAAQGLKWTKSGAKGYLAALIDGEGSVRKDCGRVEISNNDATVLGAAISAANYLGIETTLRVQNYGTVLGREPVFAVSLRGGKATRKKLLRMPIRSQKKRDLLGKYV